MSLVLVGIGVFALNRTFSGALTPDDAGVVSGVLGVAAGLLGLTLCGMFVALSLRLARVEKILGRDR
jgi:hypothetical protein